MILRLSPVWRYRHFVISAIRGEFKSRITRSRIGALWFVLHPLAMALIYVLILSEVLGAKLGGISQSGGYAVYLLAGISAWTLFSEIVNRCIGVFIEYANALKKINFPRACIPAIVVGGALINHVLLLLAAIVIIAFYGFFLNVSALALIPVVLLTVLFALGLGIVLGVMNVFSRDVAQVMLVVMNMWFWLTPIVYSVEIVPGSISGLIELNPFTSIATAYQDIILRGQWPDFASLLYPLIVAICLFLLSAFVFRRASAELVDAL